MGRSRAFQAVNMRNPYNRRGEEEEATESWMLECENYCMFRAGKLETVKHEMT